MATAEQNKMAFKAYLIKAGYKQITPSGGPSTVYDYIKRIVNISERYNLNVYAEEDIIKLEKIKAKLDRGGEDEAFGKKSNRAVYNAMARYCEFCRIKNNSN